MKVRYLENLLGSILATSCGTFRALCSSILVLHTITLLTLALAQEACADEVYAHAITGEERVIDGQTYRFTDLSGGQVAPILPAGADNGNVFFFARVSLPEGSPQQSLWLSRVTGELYPVIAPLQTPQISPGITISGFLRPELNRNGMLLVPIYLQGSGITSGVNNQAWVEFSPSNQYSIMLRLGHPIFPGSSLTVRTVESSMYLRDSLASRAIFIGKVDGPNVTFANEDLAWYVGYAPGVIARKGEIAPDNDPALADAQLNLPRLISHRNGRGVVLTTLSGPGVVVRPTTNGVVPNEQGLWAIPEQVNGTASLIPLARTGGSRIAPGTSAKLFHQLILNSNRPAVNANGAVAFPATVSNSDTTDLRTGLWSNLNGVLELIALSGEAAPEIGTGVTISNPSPSSSSQTIFISDSAAASKNGVVFLARYQGQGINSLNDLAIVRWNGLARSVLVRGGSPLSVTSYSVVNNTLSNLTANRYGEVAVRVKLAGSGVAEENDGAILSTVGGVARIVAREGDLVPGMPNYRIAEIRVSSSKWINERGQIVFTAYVQNISDPTVSTDVRTATLRVDEHGRLEPITIDQELIPSQTGAAFRALGASNSFSPESLGEEGAFSFITNAGPNGAISGTAVVSVQLQSICPADFNSDGTATVQDVFDFLTLWLAQDTGADFNRDSSVTVQDLFDFLGVWFGGCS